MWREAGNEVGSRYLTNNKYVWSIDDFPVDQMTQKRQLCDETSLLTHFLNVITCLFWFDEKLKTLSQYS